MQNIQSNGYCSHISNTVSQLHLSIYAIAPPSTYIGLCPSLLQPSTFYLPYAKYLRITFSFGVGLGGPIDDDDDETKK